MDSIEIEIGYQETCMTYMKFQNYRQLQKKVHVLASWIWNGIERHVPMYHATFLTPNTFQYTINFGVVYGTGYVHWTKELSKCLCNVLNNDENIKRYQSCYCCCCLRSCYYCHEHIWFVALANCQHTAWINVDQWLFSTQFPVQDKFNLCKHTSLFNNFA